MVQSATEAIQRPSSPEDKIPRGALDAGWKIGSDTYPYDGADRKSNSYLQTVYFVNRKEVKK